MTQLRYSTEITLDAPWLLDRKALEELDQIVGNEWIRLEQRRELMIEQAALERLSELQDDGYLTDLTEEEREEHLSGMRVDIQEKGYHPLSRQDKEVRIQVPNLGELITDSFEAVFRDPAITNESPSGFIVDVESVDIRCSVSAERDYGRLQIRATPESASEAQELFVSLRSWAMVHYAPYWQRFWIKWAGFQWSIWIFLVIIGFSLISVQSSGSTSAATSRAKDLLDSGVTQSDIPEAIELLLILQTDYDPAQPVNKPQPIWFKILFYGGFAVCVILTIKPPKVLLGIGEGSNKLKHWRRWMQVVGVTLPALIFGSFILPYLVGLVIRLLG